MWERLPTQSVAVERELGRLAKRLRSLRLGAGLTGTELARKTGWSQSKVSKTETGAQSPTEADVREWAHAVGASKRITADLVAQAKRARTDHTVWDESLRKDSIQWEAFDQETACRRIREFSLVGLPGTVQTPEYARNVLARVFRLPLNDPEIDRATALRMERGRVLGMPRKTYQMIIAEPCLYWLMYPRHVLAEQLEHLIDVAGRGSVELSILPLDAHLAVAPAHGFVIFDREVVFVDTIVGDLKIREPEAIGIYEFTFERLWASALRGPDALTVMERALAACGGAPRSMTGSRATR